MTAHRHPADARARRDPAAAVWVLTAAATVVGAAGLVGGVVSTAAHAAPKVTAAALPTQDRDMLTARGADIAPGPLALPTVVPTDAPVWEPAKGRVIVNGQPLRTTAKAAPATTAAAKPSTTQPPAPTTTTSAATRTTADETTPETTTPTASPTTEPTASPILPPPVDITATTTSAEPTP